MLVSLNDMKSYLGLTATNEWDVFLTTQIETVSEAIEVYCSRKFQSATYTQTFYVEEFPKDIDFKEIMLAVYPIVQVNSIKEYVDEDDSVGTVVSDYRMVKELGILRRRVGSRFFYNNDILEVEYEAGYTTIPVLVRSVLYSIVQERFNKKVNGIDLNFGSDIQRISIPGTIGIDFDYSLQNNERKTHLGTILGNHVNVLDAFRSERAVIGNLKLEYVS
jgi:hypothetical protein